MITFTDPFERLFSLQRALESALGSDWLGATTGMGAFPPTNLFQQGHDFLAVLELPGVSKNDLEIQAQQNTIRIAGRKSINYEDGVSIHRRERVSGDFDRTISVPVQIDPEGIKAEYRDGILALFIPRAASDKPRTIKIS
jgi:HSP20 family protein